jgi:Rrf2 family cysteine metabolism transcriptional repressor
MIRVSTRGRYALRAAVDLALYAGDGPILRREIDARQGVSADYLAQLLGPLCSAGLVEAIKGPGGGYMLSGDPATIRAGDVVRAVEGPIAVVECCLPHRDRLCNRRSGCPTYPLWRQLSQIITEYLDSVSLKELADQGGDSLGPVTQLPGLINGEPGQLARDQ